MKTRRTRFTRRPYRIPQRYRIDEIIKPDDSPITARKCYYFTHLEDLEDFYNDYLNCNWTNAKVKIKVFDRKFRRYRTDILHE